MASFFILNYQQKKANRHCRSALGITLYPTIKVFIYEVAPSNRAANDESIDNGCGYSVEISYARHGNVRTRVAWQVTNYYEITVRLDVGGVEVYYSV